MALNNVLSTVFVLAKFRFTGGGAGICESNYLEPRPFEPPRRGSALLTSFLLSTREKCPMHFTLSKFSVLILKLYVIVLIDFDSVILIIEGRISMCSVHNCKCCKFPNAKTASYS